MWNDDEIAPNTGFPPHPHADMEIITYVRQGAITHEDSLGHKGRTEAGDVQVMSAGSGIRHAEYQPRGLPTTLFQIWIEPGGKAASRPGAPSRFPSRTGRAASCRSRAASPAMATLYRSGAEARVLGATLKAGDIAEYAIGAAPRLSRSGARQRRGQRRAISRRDGAAIRDENMVKVKALADSEIVLVDAA